MLESKREVLGAHSMLYKNAEWENLTVEDYAIEEYVIDVFAINTREILLYVHECLSIDIFTEYCCERLSELLPEDFSQERTSAARFIATYMINAITREWNRDLEWKRGLDLDSLIRRDMLISSYKNESRFYEECRKAVEHFDGCGDTSLIRASLPKSDRRLDVTQSAWPKVFDFESIASAKKTTCAPKASPGIPGKDKGIVEVEQFLHILIVRLLCEEPEARRIGLENLLQKKIPAKTAKEIVNRAFLLAEMLGIDVNKEPEAREKQLIITNIAQSCLRELLFLHAADLVAGSTAKVAARNNAKKKDYAAKRYEEVRQENERLRDKVKSISTQSAAETMSKDSLKQIRAIESEKNREIEKLRKEVASLKEEREDLIELIFAEEETEEIQEENLENAARDALRGKRILVWGCRPDFKRKFDGKYPELNLLETADHHISSLPASQLAVYDGVLVLTNCCSHGMYWSVMNDVRGSGKPYVRMQKGDNSEDAFNRSIIRLCESINRKKEGTA